MARIFPLRKASLLVDCRDPLGKRSASGSIEWVEIKDLGDGHSKSEERAIRVSSKDFSDSVEFIQSISEHIVRIDPDILVTDKGDSIDFPALLSEALSEKIDLRFGRGAARWIDGGGCD